MKWKSTIFFAAFATAFISLYCRWPMEQELYLPDKIDYPVDLSRPPEVKKTLFIDSGRDFCHSASLMTFPEGEPNGFHAVAAFVSGSFEGADDVEILLSFCDGEKWLTPIVAVTAGKLATDTGRWVGKVGNPALVSDSKGTWHLFVVGAIGGWSTATIYHTTSGDFGQSWSRAKVLELSPFFGISNLVRSAPLRYTDGNFLLPIYHEMGIRYPGSAVVSPRGEILRRSKIPAARENLQPSLVASDSRKITALMRDTAMDGTGRIGVAHSFDAGISWQKSPPLELLNFDTPSEALRLDADNLIIIANGPQKGRVELNLFISTDNGQNWQRYYRLENGGAKFPNGKYPMFTYPSLRRLDEKTLAISYTWNRTRIKYLEIEIPRKEVK